MTNEAVADPSGTDAWKQLQGFAATVGVSKIRELLTQDQSRPTRLSCEAVGIHADFSRQRITSEVIEALIAFYLAAISSCLVWCLSWIQVRSARRFSYGLKNSYGELNASRVRGRLFSRS